MNRYWVFDDDALDRAISDWVAGEDLMQASFQETTVRAFLTSPAARQHKLLVGAQAPSSHSDRTPKP